MSKQSKYDLAVIGGGPGGYSAAFRAADLGLNVVIIEKRSTLGGVCLNVGCIPTKTYLHQVEVIAETARARRTGIGFGAPQIDLSAMRTNKNSVVNKLVTGLKGLAKVRKVTIVEGEALFSRANSIEVNTYDGQKTIEFEYCIVAVGSEPACLTFLPEDARIVDSTAALELEVVPGNMLVIGGGIIGLEMATIYAALGAKVDIVETSNALVAGVDRDAVNVWQKENASWLNAVFLETRVVAAEARKDGIAVQLEGPGGNTESRRYDLVLQAVGRVPNGGKVGADHIGLNVTAGGFLPVDGQMRTNLANVFAIGDVVGQPMLAHKAVHEGHVAAEVVYGELKADARAAKAAFQARVIPSVAYTHPELAWVGVTETQARAEQRPIEVARFPWAASGRALANGCEYGFTKLILDPETKVVVGGAIVGPGAGDMIGEIALAIEMGADAEDLALTIHPHPTLGETIGLVGEAALGWCTDLPPKRRS